MKCDKNAAGLALGLLFAVLHILWVISVAIGSAQGIMNWWQGLHFININFSILSFSFGKTLLLIVWTFVIGYILGWIFAWLYNKFTK